MHIIKLTDIAEITSGTYQKEITDGDLLYLQVKDFKSSYLADGELKPSIIDSGKIAKYTLIDKDLLFAAKGTSNFCALYRETMGKAVASSAFFCDSDSQYCCFAGISLLVHQYPASS